jgi:hypothetical protein
MELEPFKLRDDMRGRVLFEAAKSCFGKPNMHSVVNLRTVMSWRLMDNLHQHTITIGYEDGHDSIDIQWEAELFDSGNAVCVNWKTFTPAWVNKIHDFIENIKKPWDSWTEDELIQDPMWIYFFWKANGFMPESLHTAMVLSGGDNKFVKRYFRECQSSPPRSSPG